VASEAEESGLAGLHDQAAPGIDAVDDGVGRSLGGAGGTSEGREKA
jgi:hypothetical protein